MWYLIILVLTLFTSFLMMWYWPDISYQFYLHHSKSLPFLSENFVGRDREIKVLMKQIDFYNHSTRGVNIHGPPGFGKSTLAIHVGHAAVREGIEVHYIDMVEFPNKDVRHILATKILKKEHANFENLMEWLRDHRYWYYQILIILDNCDDVLHNQRGEFQKVVTKLVESSLYVKVLLTSREIVTLPDHFKWYKVDELSDTAAIELLKLKVPKKIAMSPSQRQEVAKLTGNVPLALQIVSSLLSLPNSPSPTEVIQELDNDLLHFLSPVHFPESAQILISISLSIKYLSPEMYIAGCYLVVFPGSFDNDAAHAVLDNSLFTETPVRHILKGLVTSSLLEINERTLRYQYHRLIRKYFMLCVELLNFRTLSNILETPTSAYLVHYAEKLIVASNQLNYDHHTSLSVLFSEQHNFQSLLDNLQGPQFLAKEFFLSVMAVSGAINSGLFRLRFSSTDWCEPIGNALKHLDQLGIKLNWYYMLYGVDVKPETFLSYYILMIGQFAKCQEAVGGVEKPMKVYTDRKDIVEMNRWKISSTDYITYYEALAGYYIGLDQEEDVLECHGKIILQAYTQLAACRPNQCDNYAVGLTYYKLGDQQKAAEFLEKALKENQTTLKRSRILVMLYISYSSLHSDNSQLALTKLLELQDHIMNVSSNELYHSDVTHLIITIFRKKGFDKEADILEDRLLEVIVEIRAQPQQVSVSMDRAYQYAKHFFGHGSYDKVIDIGTYIVESLDLQTPDDMHLKLKVELLIGKAKFHGGNYSEGMDDIETVLQEIINYPGRDYDIEDEKKTSCWYLILRIKYVNVCYDVKAKIRGVVMAGVYLLFHAPLEYHQSVADQLTTSSFEEHRSTSSNPEVKHVSSSRDVVSKEMGSLTIAPFENMEAVLTNLFNMFQAHMKEDIDLSINHLVIFTNFILSKTFYPLMKIPLVCFLINVGWIWTRLWIAYEIYKFIRHPVQSSIFIIILVFLALFGKLRLYIRILRDPRLQAAI